MIRKWKWLLPAAALGVLGAGCSFVTLDSAAQNVEVISLERAENCERVGRTRVTVADQVGFIARSDRRIRRDLDRLARNSGAEMGGDTVALASAVSEGRATYGVFKCIN